MSSQKKRKLNQTKTMVTMVTRVSDLKPTFITNKRKKLELSDHHHRPLFQKFKSQYPDLIDLIVLKDGRIVLFRDTKKI